MKKNRKPGASWQAPYPAWTCTNCPAHQSGIFSELSPAQLRELEKGRILDHYKKRQILFYEGHRPLAAYCLLSGQMKVYKTLPGGGHRILRLVGPGDLLGHEALLKKDIYEASAEALEDSYVCILPKGMVLAILEKNPGVLLRLLDKVSDDLTQTQGLSAPGFQKRHVRVRMAQLLLDLNQRLGRPVHWGSSIELPLSRSEMASMLGTTTETAIRILNRFQAQGYLTLGHHAIELKNILALKSLAR